MADPDNKTPITRASFEQDHAPLFAQLRGEFLALGATQERERIQAVLALDAHGEKELINTLAFDGKTSAGDAALAVLKAQAARTSAAAAQHQKDAPPAAPGSASAAPTNQGEDTDRSLGKRAAAAFNELRGR
jgi:hypothetical protein